MRKRESRAWGRGRMIVAAKGGEVGETSMGMNTPLLLPPPTKPDDIIHDLPRRDQLVHPRESVKTLRQVPPRLLVHHAPMQTPSPPDVGLGERHPRHPGHVHLNSW